MPKKKLKNEPPQSPLGTSLGMHNPNPSLMTLYGKHAKGTSKHAIGSTHQMVVKVKKVAHSLENDEPGGDHKHRARFEIMGVYNHNTGPKQKFNIYKK